MAKRTLVGSVGYFNLSDLSAGLMVVDKLKEDGMPPEVDICDLSYGGPIATVHRLSEARPPYDRLVLVGASEEVHSENGYRWYSWKRELPPSEEIQMRISEAVTGVIDLKSFPIIAQQFEALPSEVLIVEIRALTTGAGLTASEEVESRLPEVCRLVRDLAQAPTLSCETA